MPFMESHRLKLLTFVSSKMKWSFLNCGVLVAVIWVRPFLVCLFLTNSSPSSRLNSLSTWHLMKFTLSYRVSASATTCRLPVAGLQRAERPPSLRETRRLTWTRDGGGKRELRSSRATNSLKSRTHGSYRHQKFEAHQNLTQAIRLRSHWTILL